MRVTNPRFAITVLSHAVVCGLVLALHTGQAQSGAALTNLSKVTGGAPSS